MYKHAIKGILIFRVLVKIMSLDYLPLCLTRLSSSSKTSNRWLWLEPITLSISVNPPIPFFVSLCSSLLLSVSGLKVAAFRVDLFLLPSKSLSSFLSFCLSHHPAIISSCKWSFFFVYYGGWCDRSTLHSSSSVMSRSGCKSALFSVIVKSMWLNDWTDLKKGGEKKAQQVC